MRAVTAMPHPRELTARAVLTGAGLGATLSLCNIYSGLKIGWSFNMSITAALIGFGLWKMAEAAGAARFEKLENNINQTAASAGASISSAGLVSAIPAMTLLTGQTLSWAELSVWVFLIGCVGVLTGVLMRRQMIEVDKLPFASGIASAETLERMYASGAEAMRKVYALLGAGLAAAGLKALIHYAKIPHVALPGAIAAGGRRVTMMNATVALDPSPLMIAVGALGSLRTGVSMLTGALFAWLVLGPIAVEHGWATVPDDAGPDQAWFVHLMKWLLWPGVAMMVTASLTSVALSWRAVVRTFTGGRASGADTEEEAAEKKASLDTVPVRSLLLFGGALVVAITLTQVVLFDIAWWAALLAVFLTVALAAVAGRVSGETTITPVGAMGKVTQLVFGLAVPANPTANLMCANVTGGAASQCADLLHDLKAGAILGASPRRQSIAQTLGVLGGALAGSAAYLVLLPDPERQIMETGEWAAPAVHTWKAVAEIFAQGMSAMPPYALEAMAIGGAAGVVLTVLEKVLPKKAAPWVPNPAAFGLAFVVQAWYAISLFAGSVLGFVLRRYAKGWSELYLVPICAGVIAGESLMGFAIAMQSILAP